MEESGGYIDVTLTPKLLQISPGYFLDLLVALSEEEQRETLRNTLRDKLRENNKDQEFLKPRRWGASWLVLQKDWLSAAPAV